MNSIDVGEKLHNLIDISRQAYQKGFTGGSGGNVSVRIGGQFYISSTGTFLGSLREEDFTCMDMEGSVIKGGNPSKEFAMHMECYKRRPDIECIFHLHPLYSITVTCLPNIDHACGMPVYTPGYALRINDIPVVPYYMPGSVELAEAVAKALEGRNSVLLQNHGIVVAGKTPASVFGIAEEIEENAHIAVMLGDQGIPMTEKQIQEIRNPGGHHGK